MGKLQKTSAEIEAMTLEELQTEYHAVELAIDCKCPANPEARQRLQQYLKRLGARMAQAAAITNTNREAARVKKPCFVAEDETTAGEPFVTGGVQTTLDYLRAFLSSLPDGERRTLTLMRRDMTEEELAAAPEL